MINIEQVEAAITLLLTGLNEDLNRPGLKDTPLRIAKMYQELLQGKDDDPKQHLSVVFPCTSSEVVILKDITFFSLCEHHLLPFYGKVHLAYLPHEQVVGLSKLARVVETFARRLQIQEQLTTQIAQCIQDNLQPKGVMVIIEAEHTCLSMRGIKKLNSTTITRELTGEFLKNASLRQEVLALMKD